MNRRPSRRFRIISTAKLMLAVMLLAGFLSSIAPLMSVSAGPICRLQCCAGKTPHAAGSCMAGSCYANLQKHAKEAPPQAKPKQEEDQRKPTEGEHACGRHSQPKVLVNTRQSTLERSAKPIRSASNQPQTGSVETPRLAAAPLAMPCQSDCGGCAVGSANSNRQRHSADLADHARPRGPTTIHFFDPGYHRTQISSAFCRQCAPRGPPLFFS